MAKWIEFTSAYNHRWPSRACTFYPPGMVAYVKDEVAEAAIASGVGREAGNPGDGEAPSVPDTDVPGTTTPDQDEGAETGAQED